ncbi:MMPL family transporter [Pseudoxanthomonas sp. UTMC 1351]|uniref:MMPL family transporter n=1 Tax=Pseudoxanthomonas sp. UTMC 1351 TaxID=2695853 RepID=UPI0034CEEE08
MTEPASPNEARPNEARPGSERFAKAWRWLGLAWLLAVVAVGFHQWHFWQQSRIDSDVLALLPQDADDRVVADATRRIADASARQMVVLLGADTPERAKAAEAAFRGRLDDLQKDDQLPFEESESAESWFDTAREFYAPYRNRVLTAEQRSRLSQTSADALAQEALAALYGPMGAPRLTQWRVDPLGLWPQWWSARAAASGLRMGDDGLLQAEDGYWVVLRFQTRASAFALNGERVIQDALDSATDAARKQVPGLRELRAGVPLHAEAAAVQAHREINTIGWGSLAAVLLLTWLAFRSLRPILLVALSLLIGCAAALSVTALVFGKVHLLTLIFGASLVGVAEDYGIHWFAARQGEHKKNNWSLLRHLLPGLVLALVTSALAYLALGLAPFPGLRQMALFSVVGLAAAFLTVVCWFPFVGGRRPPETRFSQRLGGALPRWPSVRVNRAWTVAGVLAVLFVALGLWRLGTNDDLRSLQSSPRTLIEQQAQIGRLLGMPSPAQFYLVRGADAEQTLQREEALIEKLGRLKAENKIGGYRAISDWLPSRKRQTSDAALTAHAETAVMSRVSTQLGEDLQRQPPAAGNIEADAFLQSPASEPFRHLWLGPLGDGVATVVLVDDLSQAGALDLLGAQAKNLEGVRWVNRTADFSKLLGHYRQMMTWLLLVGVLLIFAVLYWRYRGLAWRALLPTLLAGLLTVALLGWLGQPLQLFNVLALMLLLGMGIDYGVFLVEHQGDPSAWLAVSVGAASTWLSFGLLALSSTPALRAFGMTLLFGIGLVWLISPLFRPTSNMTAKEPGP